MSRTRRQRESVAPSLFPFLAVLLCTMGALVLILMLIVSSAQAAANQFAEESRLRAENMETSFQLAAASYQRQLDDGRIDLEQKRLSLQHFEDHILELLDELAELELAAKLLEDDQEHTLQEADEHGKQISELEKQIAEAAKKLKQKLDKPRGDKPIFAIIPYEGSHGTHRRPIYLECTNAGVIVQPEGIVLSVADLQPPYGPGNPLDAALRAIRAEFEPASGAVTQTAYPLLIVRPSGTRTYALARSAMSGWDDQFGYELIDEDLELAFPESKPGLAGRIAKTIRLARERQRALAQAMPGRFRERNASRLASGQGNPGSLNSGLSNGSGGTSETLESFFGSNNSPSNSPQTVRDGRGDGGIANNRRGGFAFEGSPKNPQAGEANRFNGFASGDSLANGNPSGTPSFGSNTSRSPQSSGSLQTQNNAPESFFGDATSSRGESDAATGMTDSRQGAGNRNTSTAMRQGGSSTGSESQGQTGQAGEPDTSNNANSIAGSSGGGASSSGGSPSRGGAGGSTSTTQQPSDPNRQGMPQVSMQFSNQQPRESSAPVAHRRGRNWAWASGRPTQTSVVRSIFLHCFKDRWVLLPDDRNPEKGLTITFDESPQHRAEQLAIAVNRRVESWGIALLGGSWKPILRVDVASDAQWRFDQLLQLMEGSGIEIQLRNPTPATPSSNGPSARIP